VYYIFSSTENALRWLVGIYFPQQKGLRTESITENHICCIVRVNAAYYHINAALAAVQPSDMDRVEPAAAVFELSITAFH